MKIEDKFAFIRSDIFRFKRFTDASFFIFDILPSIRKASSEIISSHSKRFWKCKKNHEELKMQLIFDITLKLLLRKKTYAFLYSQYMLDNTLLKHIIYRWYSLFKTFVNEEIC